MNKENLKQNILLGIQEKDFLNIIMQVLQNLHQQQKQQQEQLEMQQQQQQEQLEMQ